MFLSRLVNFLQLFPDIIPPKNRNAADKLSNGNAGAISYMISFSYFNNNRFHHHFPNVHTYSFPQITLKPKRKSKHHEKNRN